MQTRQYENQLRNQDGGGLADATVQVFHKMKNKKQFTRCEKTLWTQGLLTYACHWLARVEAEWGDRTSWTECTCRSALGPLGKSSQVTMVVRGPGLGREETLTHSRSKCFPPQKKGGVVAAVLVPGPVSFPSLGWMEKTSTPGAMVVRGPVHLAPKGRGDRSDD